MRHKGSGISLHLTPRRRHVQSLTEEESRANESASTAGRSGNAGSRPHPSPPWTGTCNVEQAPVEDDDECSPPAPLLLSPGAGASAAGGFFDAATLEHRWQQEDPAPNRQRAGAQTHTRGNALPAAYFEKVHLHTAACLSLTIQSDSRMCMSRFRGLTIQSDSRMCMSRFRGPTIQSDSRMCMSRFRGLTIQSDSRMCLSRFRGLTIQSDSDSMYID